MHRLRLPVTALRVFLVFLFGFALLMQIMSLPGQFAHDAGQTPKLAQLSWTLLVVTELAMLGLQIVIVCTWKLLTMVQKDRIFSESSLSWVNGIVWTFSVGWVLLVGVSTYISAFLFFTPSLRDPGLPILLFGFTLVATVVVLLIVILRALLRQATVLRADMDVVI
ncbi:Protein of unknown function (DUF2975) [Glaciihabitans tibetensis]|uniref:DUF2975 family protein n=1 Tax=Glaciihabitans tibetensis TaxID=1266600 RepID=A0A2T0VFN9_9MICO|nr:DUF2975 domain-containing protein [Glaciihabitans tibetensis]PRY68986.1 Protein of unknown function (DUF2975) [Glaciihabitans tibetensis]